MLHYPRIASVAVILCLALISDASAARRPNVLMIVVDDLNCDLGCYGHDLVQSPNIDRLAAGGLLLEKAYCQNPVCNPSRSSFMTGRYPETTRIVSNAGHFREHLPDVTTLTQHFMRQGYRAARVGKIFHYGVPTQIGTDGRDDPPSWNEVRNPIGLDRAVEEDIHTLVPGKFGGTLSWLSVESKDEQHTDGVGAKAAIKLMDRQRKLRPEQPLFLAVGFYRPHTPYVAPAHYFDLYPREAIQPRMMPANDRDDIPLAALPDRPHQLELTTPKRKEIIQAYYASISFVDAQVGRVLDALEEHSLADNTIVVFFSDHGYHLGAHGLWQKSDLFEGSTRVPLIIRDPRHPGTHGKRSDSLAELIDVYPTLSALCGLPAPVGAHGLSLHPLLDDPERSVRDSAYSVTECRTQRRDDGTKFLGRSIRTPRYRYTEWGGGEFGKELYDYAADPSEHRNLVNEPQMQKTVSRLHRLLQARAGQAGRRVRQASQ